MNNPFVKPEARPKRPKILLFGPFGTYKTRTALGFPAPAILDLEAGTEFYREEFDFMLWPESTNGTRPAITIAGIENCIDWLATNEHDRKTLIVDPITVWWQLLMDDWASILHEVRADGKAGKHDKFYEIQPSDYRLIKQQNTRFMRKLNDIDMTVVVTAHQKKEYKEGSFMVPTGEVIPDGEKTLPYFFDTVINTGTKDGQPVGVAKKDRSGCLPLETEFPLTYEYLADKLGIERLERVATPMEYATNEQKAKFTLLVAEWKPEKVTRALHQYGVESFAELTPDVAQQIIDKLEQNGKDK